MSEAQDLNLQKQREKQRTKMMLIEKLKNIRIKSQSANSIGSFSSLNSFPTPVNPVKVNVLPSPANLNLTNKNQNQGTYQFQNQMMEDQKEGMMKKYQNQLVEEEEEEPKEVKKTIRTRRPYYEHYSKEGIFEPVLEYVRNHPNPSGKPPGITPQMYDGIEVVPKRPWVFFGPENIPPSSCPQINQKVFSQIFAEAKRQKGTNAFKKGNKKKGKKNEDDISEASDDLTSNFTFSDSVDLSKESDLISEFRTHTKTNKVYDSSKVVESEVQDDFSSVSGSVTQKNRYNLFDSSESEQEESSFQAAQRKQRFKKLLESSDEQPEKNSTLRESSRAGHSSKASSGQVQVDYGQSSASKSKNISQPKAKSKAKDNKQESKKSSTGRKPKLQLDSD